MVTKILEVLKGRVLANLNRVKVLWTMVEGWVQPLKQWTHLLCDYTETEDLTRRVTVELEVDAIEERVAGLVGLGTVVVAKMSLRCSR